MFGKKLLQNTWAFARLPYDLGKKGVYYGTLPRQPWPRAEEKFRRRLKAEGKDWISNVAEQRNKGGITLPTSTRFSDANGFSIDEHDLLQTITLKEHFTQEAIQKRLSLTKQFRALSRHAAKNGLHLVIENAGLSHAKGYPAHENLSGRMRKEYSLGKGRLYIDLKLTTSDEAIPSPGTM